MIKITATIEDYKKMFFRDDFARKLASSNTRSLSLFGRNVRRSAQRRIKNARRMPLGSMSPQERNAYKNAQRRAKALGQPAPLRPFQASAPGEAPRNRTGKLKKHIYYGLEGTGNVIIGPAWLPSKEGDTAKKLEKGGQIRRHRTRPVNKIGRFGIMRVKDNMPIYGRLRTDAQVARANNFDDQLFGKATADQVQLFARPYMQPSFNETMVEIPRLFANSIR